MTTRPQKTAAQAPPAVSFTEFVGTEQMRLLANTHGLHQELNVFAQVDALYRRALAVGKAADQATVPVQMLLHCHYRLYHALAALLRSHVSDAYASLRTAIEAGLHAYRAVEGDGAAEPGKGRDTSFVYTIAAIRSERAKNKKALPLAESLLKVHDLCGQIAAQADFGGFAERLQASRTKVPFLAAHYFQQPAAQPELQFYTVVLLHTFAVILLAFETLLRRRTRTVDDAWAKELRRVEAMLRDWQEQLMRSGAVKGVRWAR